MASPLTLKLGYLVPEFPSQTHAFFWREVQALQGLGAEVHLISTRRPAAGKCRHAFAAAAIARTRYLFPPDWVSSLGHLLQRPARTLGAIRYVLGLPESRWRERLQTLPLLLPAAQLSAHAEHLQLTHIHVHSCANAAHVAAIARLLAGVPYSLVLHGDLPVYGKDHRQKFAHARFVACVTRPLREQVRAVADLLPSRVPLLWMGVDTTRFIDGGLRRPVTGELRILTVARLNRAKGHRYALRALRLLLDHGLRATYLIAGEGPDRKGIEAEIRGLGLESHAQLLGEQSEDQVLRHLQRADVLVLSSVGLGEAAPVAVMEAMACGLPVVSSIIGGTRDMISDGVDGFLVEQEDVEAMARTLNKLANDLPLRTRIGRSARERAEREFDCLPLARALFELIRASNHDWN